MNWILVIILSGNSGVSGVTTEEFRSEKTCNEAKIAVMQMNRHIKAGCVSR